MCPEVRYVRDATKLSFRYHETPRNIGSPLMVNVLLRDLPFYSVNTSVFSWVEGCNTRLIAFRFLSDYFSLCSFFHILASVFQEWEGAIEAFQRNLIN